MIKKGDKVYTLPLDCFNLFNNVLQQESDRACIILAAAWIDRFLELKLRNEFSKGNAKSREALFSENGPFSTFSAKLNAAFCAGWIDSDVFHDANIIRKLRNDFAHTVDQVSLDGEKPRRLLESLRVPHRQFTDWGKLRVAKTAEGICFYTGNRPSNAEEDLNVPGVLTFKITIPLVMGVLVANLGVYLTTEEEGCLTRIRLPQHMTEGQ